MFDWDKLNWINGQYIRALSDEELAERLRPFLPDLPEATVRAAAPALKTRLPRLGAAAELLGYLREAPAPPELTRDQREMVQAAVERLEGVEWTAEAIESALDAVREEHGWSKGKFFTTVRHVVAGPVSPPLHNTLALLSKVEALSRMRKVLA
jgi:glutamyl-tRNA synthetase